MTGQADFLNIVAEIAKEIGGAVLDAQLEAHLNERIPAQGEQFSRLAALCAQGEVRGLAHEPRSGRH